MNHQFEPKVKRLIFISYMSTHDYPAGVDALKFLNNPPQVLSGFLGMNAIINCTTDEANATVKLFYSKNFVTYQERALSPEKLHLNGQVFTLLNLGVNDGGKYRCTATNHQQTINWPSSFGILFVTRGGWNTSTVELSDMKLYNV